jgi:hypothetical protein
MMHFNLYLEGVLGHEHVVNMLNNKELEEI